MTNIFSPQEILRIAVKVEERGKKLYEALEQKTVAGKVKELWKYLKEQEEIHRKIFQDMLDKIGDYIVPELNAGEYDAYIRAIGASYIFTEELIEKKLKESFASDLEAIDFGLHIEKESILTYSALREYIMLEKRQVLDKVIAEEKEHLIKLTVLRGEIKR
ncbi:MAG: ferritin family protein [Candidatus Omnitrophota bacterium]